MNAIFRTAIFDPGFPLDGPHLVEASAGTGKTYNIQNVCARLVMERGLRVSQIQVMTFTEAATKELRDRIRKVFANLALLLEGREGDIRKKDGTRDEKEIARLESLRECARKRLGGEPAEADAQARIRVELALLEFDQAAISTIHGFCRRALVRFAFETGAAFRTEFADDKDADLKRRARDWWRAHRPSYPLADLQKTVKELGGKTDWEIEKDPASGDDDGLAAAADIVARYEGDRPLRETQTFDDLLRAVRAALDDPRRGPNLARHLREEFKAVVVDEFQDTDPVQYGIFWKAFLEGVPENERPPVFFVGDPKQAIYSFRGGDIFTYRKAVGQIGDDRTYRLDRNYRSNARLVRAVNLLFKDEKAGGTFARTFGDDAIPYEEDVEPSNDVGFLPVPSEDGSPVEDPHPFRVVRAKDREARQAAVVDAVLRTLDEQRKLGTMVEEKVANKDGSETTVQRPFGPRDIVVLATHADSAVYCGELRGRGVPVVLQKSGNVFAGETAAEFRLVLMAMAGIGGRDQIRSALSTPFFDFPAEELESMAGEAFAEKVGLFRRLARTWVKRGFNAAFAKLEDECGLRARFARLPDGERRLADLFQIVDLTGAAIRERGPSPGATVDWLTERINASESQDEEQDSDEYARELETEADAVRIMTTHASKGLEFPVAIVSVGRGKYADKPYFHHLDGETLRVGCGKDAKKGADKENDDEKMRLLYVAFTRASKRTIAVSAFSETKKSDHKHSDNKLFELLLKNARQRGAGEDNPADSPILWSDYESASDSEYRPTVDDKPLSEALVPRDYGDFGKRRKGSYSLLSPSKKIDPDDPNDEETDNVQNAAGESDDIPGWDEARTDARTPSSDFTAPSAEETGDGPADHPIFDIGGGARTGTCWHDILEKLPFDAGKETIREATEKSMRLHGLARGEQAEVDERIGLVADMIGKTLEWSIVPPSGEPFAFTLRDVKTSERFSEWEFDFSSARAENSTHAIAKILRTEWKDDPEKERFLEAVENWDREIPKGFFVGFLDLLFEHDGFWYVVDWKSNKVGGKKANFSKTGIRDEMAREGYFFQYLLYSAVLHRFLKETMGADYSWEKNFGGIRYYFLRGIAAGGEAPVFEDRPSERLLDRLCEALGLED